MLFSILFRKSGSAQRVLALLVLTLACSTAPAADSTSDLLTAFQRAWLKAHPNLSIGMPSDYPPAVIKDADGRLSGIGPDFVDLLNQRLGTDIRIDLGYWSEVVERAERREVDMIGFTFPLEAYQNRFRFTTPVFQAYYYLYARSDDAQPPGDLAALSGKRVGYFAATRIVEQQLGKRSDLELVPLPSAEALVVALLTKRIDVIVANFSLEYWRKKTTQIGFRVAAMIPQMGGDLVIAVRNDWPELQAILDTGLATITASERQAILDRWMGTDPMYLQQTRRIRLEAAENAWLTAHPLVRVGIAPSWAPIQFIDEGGAQQGIAVAYLQRLEQLLGLHFELVSTPSWAAALTQLADGRVDLLPALDATRKSRPDMHLTEPYVSFPAAIFSAEDVAYLGGIDSLRGKTVAVVRGDVVEDWLRRAGPELQVLQVADTREALRRVTEGEAFAFVGNLVTTSYYIGQSGLTRIKVAGETPFVYRLGMGVRQDQPVLASLLQKGLDAIPKSQRDAIYHEWLSIRYSHDMDFDLLWRVLAAAVLLICVIVWWNRRLMQEISRRHRAEAALREAKEAAEEANRAKSAFLANISHELRTPLNLVLGFAALLQETERNDRERGWLNSIRSAGKTLAALIDDLLDLTRIEAGQMSMDPRVTDLRALLQELAAMFAQSVAHKGLSLEVVVDDALPVALVLDDRRLRQILVNLLGNAVKFTDAGRIELRAAVAQVGCGGQRLSVAVTDAGPGIDTQEQQRIFDPFFQGSAATPTGGAGLGLAIGRRLARLMGGDLSLRSTLGHGSTFTLDLPLVVAADTAADAGSRVSPVYTDIERFAPARLLIVDDRADNRDLLRHYLREHPFEIIEAGDGVEALRMVRDRRPDLILMDIAMVGMDGLTAARRLRAQPATAAIPILAVTAAATLDDDATLRQTFDAVLHKPLAPAVLLDCLARWLAPAQPIGERAQPVTAPSIWPPPLALSPALYERLQALHTPYVSINEMQDFTDALREEADAIGDVAMQEAANALRQAAEHFESAELMRQIQGLQQRARCGPMPVPARYRRAATSRAVP